MDVSPPQTATRNARLDPRVARSRAVIVTAATAHFLRDGYPGTSVDDIAATAQVSKRTVYNIFGGKEQLFRAILTDTIDFAENFAADATSALADTDDPEAELRTIAVRLAAAVVGGGQIILLRRLLIAEAARFPEIASDYYDRAPGRVMNQLADALRRLDQRGLLRIDDPTVAAEHFAFLVMGAQLDRAMFTAVDEPPPIDDIEAHALRGVDAFLRAYGPHTSRDHQDLRAREARDARKSS